MTALARWRAGGGAGWPMLRSLRSWLGLLGLLAVALLALPARAQDVQPVPALSGRVVDSVGLLGAAQAQALGDKLAAFETRSGSQIVLLLVATTAPEDIASYAQRVGDAWKIGRRQVGDGLLLVVARDDRKVRIEVAKTLEGAVPDLAARRIIDQQIAPAFKRGDYAAGLDAGIDALIARIQGEALPAPDAPAADGTGGRAAEGFNWQNLAIFFFVGVPVVGGVLSRVLGRKLGALATALGAGGMAVVLGAGLVVAAVAAAVALVLVGVIGVGGGRIGGLGGFPPIGWGGGGRGGGGGGGGFRSGGGGDFGGGGASGGW